MVEFIGHWCFHLPPVSLYKSLPVCCDAGGPAWHLRRQDGSIHDESLANGNVRRPANGLQYATGLESILPSDSPSRRVPGYRLWKTRVELNVDRAGSYRFNPNYDHQPTHSKREYAEISSARAAGSPPTEGSTPAAGAQGYLLVLPFGFVLQQLSKPASMICVPLRQRSCRLLSVLRCTSPKFHAGISAAEYFTLRVDVAAA